MNAEFAETRTRMTTDAKWFLLAHVLFYPDLFQSAAYYLRPEYFSEADEPHFRLLWRVVLEVSKLNNGTERLFGVRQHAWDTVTTAAKAAAESGYENLPEVFYSQLFDHSAAGFIHWAYSEEAREGLNLDWGRDLLQQFLDERYVNDYLQQQVSSAAGNPFIQLPILLREVDDRRSHVDALSKPVGEDAFPLDWQPKRVPRVSTGIVWLDENLNGGHVAGEMYGLLGGFSSGKTTFGVQLMVEAGNVEADRFNQHGGQLRYSYAFHYEAGIEEYRNRILSYAAKIDRDKLDRWGHAAISTTGHLDTYERELFKDQIAAAGLGCVPGERERWAEAMLSLRRNLRLFDMSGPVDRPKQGSGGIQEIVRTLEREKREGRMPCCVVIDYVGLCVRRFVLENNLDDFMNFRLITDFGISCLRQIAVPFQTPVWILHQISGEANKRTWASTIHLADSAGSKSFAENLHYCFQLGMRHPTHKAMRFYCAKARRSDIGRPPLIYPKFPVSALLRADHLEELNGELYERNDGGVAVGAGPAFISPSASGPFNNDD